MTYSVRNNIIYNLFIALLTEFKSIIRIQTSITVLHATNRRMTKLLNVNRKFAISHDV